MKIKFANGIEYSLTSAILSQEYLSGMTRKVLKLTFPAETSVSVDDLYPVVSNEENTTQITLGTDEGEWYDNPPTGYTILSLCGFVSGVLTVKLVQATQQELAELRQYYTQTQEVMPQ